MLIITASVSLFSSCRKEGHNDDTCKTDMSHIAGTYKLTALEYKASASGSGQDFLQFLDDCEKDDVLVLHANGAYNYNDMGKVCTPDGSGTGTWSVSDNHLLTSDNSMLKGIVSSFDCKVLVYYVSGVYTTGDTLTYTMTRQ